MHLGLLTSKEERKTETKWKITETGYVFDMSVCNGIITLLLLLLLFGIFLCRELTSKVRVMREKSINITVCGMMYCVRRPLYVRTSVALYRYLYTLLFP